MSDGDVDEASPIDRGARQREEDVARLHLATVELEVAALREHGGRDLSKPRQAVHDHGIQAGHRASRMASSGAFVCSIGPSGSTCSVRSVAAVICANTGAATMPP